MDTFTLILLIFKDTVHLGNYTSVRKMRDECKWVQNSAGLQTWHFCDRQKSSQINFFLNKPEVSHFFAQTIQVHPFFFFLKRNMSFISYPLELSSLPRQYISPHPQRSKSEQVSFPLRTEDHWLRKTWTWMHTNQCHSAQCFGWFVS